MPISYIALYRPGPNWLAGKPLKDQPLKAHLDYLLGLHERGKLTMGGPFADESGGLVVFSCENSGEADAMLTEDPAVIEGVLVGDIKQWSRVV